MQRRNLILSAALSALLARCPGLTLDPSAPGPAGAEFRKPPSLPVVWSDHA